MYEFTYHRPATVAAAAKFMAEEPEAKIIAGGYTLIPVLKQRLARPACLVDISRIPGLAGIATCDGELLIGAMTRHAAIAASPIITDFCPALAYLAGLIGDPAVRNAGTIGGSLANNDPTADYAAACLALDATIETNRRALRADDFFQGLFSTALEPDEIITRVRISRVAGAAYEKIRNRASRYALAGVFVARHADAVHVAVTGSGADGVFRARDFEETLSREFSAAAIAGLSIDPASLMDDWHASAEFRSHLIGVATARAVAKCEAVALNPRP